MENTIVTETEKLISEINSRIKLRKKEIEEMRELDRPVSKENPLVISFVGRFKTGKSSLINALIGRELLPTRSTTATAVVTHIVKGSKTCVWLCENGSKKSITMENAKDIILNYKTKSAENCAEIIFELPIPWLSNHVEIRDTPGMDDSDQDGILEEVAMRSLRDTDLCICVYDAQQMLSSREREITEKIREMLAGNTVFVVNRINLINSRENMELIKKQAKSYFTEQGDASYGIGKFFMISSAPGNLYLDNFDTWIKKIATKSNPSMNQAIRTSSVDGRIKMLAKDLIADYDSDLDALSKQLADMQRVHHQELSKKKDSLIRAAKTKSESFMANTAPEALRFLCNTDSLRGKLDSMVQKEKNAGTYANADYSKLSSKVVEDHFKSRYNEMCVKWPAYFKRDENRFISDTISRTTFPGRHSVNTRASTGERLGGAGAGAAVGFIFGGPIGALIGAALGGAVGGADDVTDDSVSNTMNFVRNTVINSLKNTFNACVLEISNRIKNDVGSCTSGYESMIHKLDMEKKRLSSEKEKLNEIIRQ